MTPPLRVPSRELTVLACYVRSGSTRAAAAELGISANTARCHLTMVRRRVGATNTTQAAWLLRRDLERLLPDMPAVPCTRRVQGR